MDREAARVLQYLFGCLFMVFSMTWLLLLYYVAPYFPNLAHPPPEFYIIIFSDTRFIGLIASVIMSLIFGHFKNIAEKQSPESHSQTLTTPPTRITGEFLYCIECGFKNIATAKFCRQCGVKIE